MISAEEPVFPNNITALLKMRCQMIDTDLFVVERPLRSSDPEQSIGIVPVQWSPIEDSTEMLGRRSYGPTLNHYTVGIQAFIKDMDEERGLAAHSVLSAKLRAMLYHDDALRVGFATLSVTMNGSTERAQRWGITRQSFVANEITGSFLYLSTLEFWLETETT